GLTIEAEQRAHGHQLWPYFVPRLVKHWSLSIIRLQNVVKNAAFSQQCQTSGNPRVAGRRRPPVLVRRDTDVQSARRLLGRNPVERTQTGPRPGPDADRGSR